MPRADVKIIEQYLDIIIDDRIGLLDNDIFSIDLDTLLDFLTLRGKKRQRAKTKYTQDTYANIARGEDYKVFRDDKQAFVTLTPFCFKKHLLVSDTTRGKCVRRYFIQIEKIYRKCLMAKVAKKNIEGVKELIL